MNELIKELIKIMEQKDEKWDELYEAIKLGNETQTVALRELLKMLELSDKRWDELYEAIKHGSYEHKQWLKEAIENFKRGKPVPEPRG